MWGKRECRYLNLGATLAAISMARIMGLRASRTFAPAVEPRREERRSSLWVRASGG